MPEYVYSLVIVIAIVVVMIWWVAKKRKEVWKGEVIKKNYSPGDSENSPSYTIVFKTDEGKKKRFTTADSKYYDQWNEGDRAEKKKGEFFPTKV